MTKIVHNEGWPHHPRNDDGIFTLDVTVRETGKKLAVQGDLEECIKYIAEELEPGFIHRFKYEALRKFFHG